MSVKKKLSMGIMSALLGIALIGGGTFAYFSGTAVQTNTFASGTLSLSSIPEVNVELDNIKPGDWTYETFELYNDGTLDIQYVDLSTSYSVKQDGVPVGSTLADQYADSIIVEFLRNTGGDEPYDVILELTLYQLANMTQEDFEDVLDQIDLEWEWVNTWPYLIPWIGYWNETEEIVSPILEVGETAYMDVRFKFEYLDEDQNHLQNLDLELTWTFEGYQTPGEYIQN
ncbi:TasA family protein [Evansella tamaricis]|uniref:M73 family metallopeptidase n=1 Tax=Evansella tamaricis TaxID=2069301 RepID=A0ABS6JET2_9BACI|nr:TasA family protein [Evansella tamaricis]MBU9712106.1 M73 family metallopeptidase [Evansella tamaricis]